MEFTPLGSSFFGSGVIWLLLTFPAYWLFQWTVEGEPFQIWRTAAEAVETANEVSQVVTQSLVEAGSSLAAADTNAAAGVDPSLSPIID